MVYRHKQEHKLKTHLGFNAALNEPHRHSRTMSDAVFFSFHSFSSLINSRSLGHTSFYFTSQENPPLKDSDASTTVARSPTALRVRAFLTTTAKHFYGNNMENWGPIAGTTCTNINVTVHVNAALKSGIPSISLLTIHNNNLIILI